MLVQMAEKRHYCGKDRNNELSPIRPNCDELPKETRNDNPRICKLLWH